MRSVANSWRRAPWIGVALLGCGPSIDPTPADDPDRSAVDDTDAAPHEPPPTRCLGREDLCDRPLDTLTLATTHNAMSNADEGWYFPNQQHPPRQQLQDGIRAMMLDTYWWEGHAALCHGFCELGTTPLADVLAEIGDFLRANPGEILLIIFENSIDAAQLDDAMADAGVQDLRYTHPDGADWPTPRQLSEAGTPLIVTVERPGSDDPPWHPPFYDLGFDTPFSFDSEEAFTCRAFRGSPSHDLFLINHWLSVPLPTRDGAAQVNQRPVLEARIDDCAATHGRLPNLLAVDHYDLGDLFEVVDALNNLGPDATSR